MKSLAQPVEYGGHGLRSVRRSSPVPLLHAAPAAHRFASSRGMGK